MKRVDGYRVTLESGLLKLSYNVGGEGMLITPDTMKKFLPLFQRFADTGKLEAAEVEPDKPKCARCGDTGRVPWRVPGDNITLPCPDCGSGEVKPKYIVDEILDRHFGNWKADLEKRVDAFNDLRCEMEKRIEDLMNNYANYAARKKALRDQEGGE